MKAEDHLDAGQDLSLRDRAGDPAVRPAGHIHARQLRPEQQAQIAVLAAVLNRPDRADARLPVLLQARFNTKQRRDRGHRAGGQAVVRMRGRH